jgi:colicin import membrane protein
MTFPAAPFAEWPKHIARSDGTTITASGPAEVEEFLKGDADALAAHKEAEAMAEQARKIEATRAAAILKANSDADAAHAKLLTAKEDKAKADAEAAAKAAEAQAKKDADAAEAQAKKDADAAEAQAKKDADAAEPKPAAPPNA